MKPNPKDIHVLFFLVFISSFIYSIFINPISTEHVEFAQTLAGLIKISKGNVFYIYRQSDPTLQVVIPAVLLKMGASTKILSLASSWISQLVPFLTISLLIFLLTQNIILSFLSILIFLGSHSEMNHFYVLSFPADFFVFGNLATWGALLTIALMLNRYKKIGSLFTGVMFSVHLVWAIASFLYFIFIVKNEESNKRKSQIVLFLIGTLISAVCLATFKYYEQNYFKKSFYAFNTDPVEEKKTASKDTESDKKSKDTTENKVIKRSTFQGHNPLLYSGDFAQDIKNLMALLEYSFYTFLLWFFLKKKKWFKDKSIDLLIKPYFYLFGIVMASLIFIDINGYFNISEAINTLALRAIPNRYLNLSYVLTQTLTVASIIYLVLKTKHKLNRLFLLGFTFIYAVLPYKFSLLLIFIILTHEIIFQFIERHFSSKKWQVKSE